MDQSLKCYEIANACLWRCGGMFFFTLRSETNKNCVLDPV